MKLKLGILCAVVGVSCAVVGFNFFYDSGHSVSSSSQSGLELTIMHWLKFSSVEGGFSILMPAKPTEGNFDLQTANTKVTVHAFTALSESIDVKCGYSDFPSVPQDSEKVFDRTLVRGFHQ